ncbi:hypothetical protein O3P69_014360 [Scylla paramamosain]|uniref:Uncharacterized protein n=1 Tax=Scylla paramamosain TaxID=85552 RepID=A0AAW0TE24_SCYPA
MSLPVAEPLHRMPVCYDHVEEKEWVEHASTAMDDDPFLLDLSRDLTDEELAEIYESLAHGTEIHAEPDRTFGEDMGGHFNGMVGQLQREESDITTIVARTPARIKVVDYLRWPRASSTGKSKGTENSLTSAASDQFSAKR